MLNSILGTIQDLRFGKQIEQAHLEQDPVFIIGHWRSGTTFLHELLSRDQRFAAPTTYECLTPSHFLVSSKIVPPLIRLLVPGKRPMDDLPLGLDSPQEDELALCAMGAPTPMKRIAFPDNPPPHMDMLNMQASEKDIENWRRALLQFIRTLTLARPQQRLLLKSPPHTGRIAHLLAMFPDARFIHLSRDPYQMFPSTQRLWKTLDHLQGFQIARHHKLEPFIIAACEKMYQGYAEQKNSIPHGKLYEIKYEDLLANPMAQVQGIYQNLALGDFRLMKKSLSKYLTSNKNHQPHQYELNDETKTIIRQRWHFYFERFGY